MKAAETKTPATSSKQNKPFFQQKSEQSFIGKNAAADSFFSGSTPAIQTKLTIGQPGDKYEQEADAMADTVVQRLSNSETVQASSSASSSTPLLQAKCAACEEEEKLQKKEEREEQKDLSQKIQTKPVIGSSLLTNSIQRQVAGGAAEAQVERLHEKDNISPETALKAQEAISVIETTETAPAFTQEPEDLLTETATTATAFTSQKDTEMPAISAKSEGAASEPTGDLQQQLNASNGGGSPLDAGTRSLMEEQMGADFSGVRVHTGSNAVGMNQALSAQAFTHGNNIYFNEGKFNPGTTSGKHLLAHELTHTIQQGASVQLKSKQVSQTGQPAVQRGILGDVWDATGGKVVSGVKSGAKWAGGKVVAGAKWVGNKAKDAVMWIYDEIVSLINRGITWLENRWAALENFARGGLDAIMQFFEGIVEFVKNPFGFIADAIMNMDAEGIKRSWDNLTGFVLKIWDGFQKVGMGLLNSVGKLWNTIDGFVSKLFKGIDKLTSNWAFRKLPSSFQSLVQGFINRLRSLWNMISSGWTNIFTKIRTFVDNAFNTIREFIKQIFSFAIDTIISGILLFGKVLVFIMDFLQNPMKYLQPLAEKLVGYLGGVEGAFPGQINRFLGGAVPATAGAAVTTAAPSPALQKTGAGGATVIQKKEQATPKRDSATWAEIGEGVWDVMKKKWEEVKKDPLSIILNLLRDLALPIIGNVEDIIKLFKDIKQIVTKPFRAGSLKDFWTSLLHLLDIPILLYNAFWSIVGRTLALPLLVASFIPHPLVKGIAIAAGYALLGALIQGELANIGHKVLLLKTGNTDDEEKKDAYNRLSDSLIAFAMEVIMAILIFIVSSVASVIKGVFNFVRSKVFKPKVTSAKPSGKGKGGDSPDLPDSGKKKATAEESKSKLESTKGKDGKDLTPEEIKAEIDAFKDGKLKKSDSPDYDWEIELPNGHTWKRKKNGKWCRFSSAHCFDDIFVNDRQIYEHLKKEGLVTESFDEFMKIKPGGPPSGTDITAEIKSGQRTKPTTGNWKQAPKWDKWVKKGGRVLKHGDGSVTYISKDGKWVKYNSNGYPDFSNHLTHPEIKSVDLPGGFSKNRKLDYKKANERANKPEWGNNPPDGYRWHHHEKGIKMQLVPVAIHELFTHAGGVSKL